MTPDKRDVPRPDRHGARHPLRSGANPPTLLKKQKKAIGKTRFRWHEETERTGLPAAWIALEKKQEYAHKSRQGKSDMVNSVIATACEIPGDSAPAPAIVRACGWRRAQHMIYRDVMLQVDLQITGFGEY